MYSGALSEPASGRRNVRDSKLVDMDKLLEYSIHILREAPSRVLWKWYREVSFVKWETPDFQEIIASAEVTAYVYSK